MAPLTSVELKMECGFLNHTLPGKDLSDCNLALLHGPGIVETIMTFSGLNLTACGKFCITRYTTPTL